MNKITLILIHRDLYKKEGYVINCGVSEEFIRSTFCNFDGFSYDTATIAYVMRNTIRNYELYRALDLSNNYNRDQSKINVIKRNAEAELESEGFTIIQHCDSSSVDPINIDYDVIKEYRDILDFKQTLQKQNINLQNENKQLDECIYKKKQYLRTLDSQIYEAQKNIETAASIKERNSEAFANLDETISRYKAGKKCLEELEHKINELTQEKTILQNEILHCRTEINNIANTKKEKAELAKLWKEMTKAGLKISDIHSYMYKVGLDKLINDTKVVNNNC